MAECRARHLGAHALRIIYINGTPVFTHAAICCHAEHVTIHDFTPAGGGPEGVS